MPVVCNKPFDFTLTDEVASINALGTGKRTRPDHELIDRTTFPIIGLDND